MEIDQSEFTPYPISSDEPLAEEHRVIAQLVEEASRPGPHRPPYSSLDLKQLSSGERILQASADQARRYVVASVTQSQYYRQLAENIQIRIKSRQPTEADLDIKNQNSMAAWNQAGSAFGSVNEIIRALMKRKLPFTQPDLIVLVAWCNQAEHLSTPPYPIGPIVRALEAFAKSHPLGDKLRAEVQTLSLSLQRSHEKEVFRFSSNVDDLLKSEDTDCGNCDGTVDNNRDVPVPHQTTRPIEKLAPPQPAPAGDPHVLASFKRHFGLTNPSSQDDAAERQLNVMGTDRFELADDSTLRAEHELLTQLIDEWIAASSYTMPQLQRSETGRRLLQRSPTELGRLMLAATERHLFAATAAPADYADNDLWNARRLAAAIPDLLREWPLEVTRDGAFDLLLYLALRPAFNPNEYEKLVVMLLELIEREASRGALSEGERYVLSMVRSASISNSLYGHVSAIAERMTRSIGDAALFCLLPGEVWSDAVNHDLSQMPATEQRRWLALFSHLQTATSARPNKKWMQLAESFIQDIGQSTVCQHIRRWLPLVSQGRSLPRIFFGGSRGAGDTMIEANAIGLRGLLWIVANLGEPAELARLVTSVALSAYKKIPGTGPRAVKVGNAAVYALSLFPASESVGQLAMLKIRVKFGTAQKEIDKAFSVAAESLGLSRDEIEEMGVPSYGLEAAGRREELIGDYRAELVVTGSSARLNWFDSKGKPLQSVPAKISKEHQEELKELQQAVKDIQGMLPAQRDRLDSMMLLDKSWPFDIWRDRYLQHPLVGTIVTRLLWCIDGVPAIFVDGIPTDVAGNPIEHGKTADVTLWHPVGRAVDEITAWRRRLESLEITQPFKQAHRELYLLTDAERHTRTYSNRFAAHILRQHQFNALCAVRGWKNQLRLMVDSSYPPASKELPHFNLRAEFWIETIHDDQNLNESGVYLRVATDQVRFYRTAAARNLSHGFGGGYENQATRLGANDLNEPVPLEDIPPLVFSEVMRDVDLFVGVASIGNDPTWFDGGPEGRHVAYWRNYSFGELTGSASTRKAVLERLVPRLKIASQCSFSERFLVVQGKLRTYKIHLGSGNILMEPNDQYLCIVPDTKTRNVDLYLPFEGDSGLSIIISKALLLADDDKIKDPTIKRQIDYR